MADRQRTVHDYQRAVYAKLTAIDLDHRHHARLIEVDPQALRPFAECRRKLFRLNKVHHQLFAQAAVLGEQMHQARLLQHHFRRHTDQLAIFTQGLRLAGQADNPHNLAFKAQR